jgi:hypothetical protein
MAKYDRNDFMPELTRIGDQVEYALKNYPETRKSDKALEIRVWELFYGIIMLRDLIKKRVPPSSGIRRWRRRFNSWQQYLPSEEEQKKRKANEMAYFRSFTERTRNTKLYDEKGATR